MRLEFIQFPLTKGKIVIDTKEVRDADDNPCNSYYYSMNNPYYSVELTIGQTNQKLTALLGHWFFWIYGLG